MKPTGAGLLAGTLLSGALLAGCASSSPDRGHVVVGSGSSQDRQDIEASNQQILQTEQAGVPSTSVNAPVPTAPSPEIP